MTSEPGKLRRDLVWSVGSLAILAVSGVVINLIIAVFRDASALGIFNQAYAAYIIVSQIASFGVHYSVMRSTALHDDDPGERKRLLVSAAATALLLGSVFAGALFTAAPWLGRVLSSPQTGEAIGYASLGILLFPLNKVLIAYLNGMRHMRAFAIFQSLRYVVVAVWIGVVSYSSVNFGWSALAFLVAEIVTAAGVIAYLGVQRLASLSIPEFAWVKRHLSFGGRSLFAGIFLEMNTRVDVILIGFFMTDRDVGIYSFAAMLVDGVYHLLAVVRTNLNPILVSCIKTDNAAQARKMMRDVKIYLIPATALFSLAIFVAFWIAVALVFVGRGLEEGVLPLIVLLSGLTLISAFVPFDNLMIASGHPTFQTLQQFVVLVSNVVLNLLLIPPLGILGAALGTAGSYLLGTLVLQWLAYRLVGWNLLMNRVAPAARERSPRADAVAGSAHEAADPAP